MQVDKVSSRRRVSVSLPTGAGPSASPCSPGAPPPPVSPDLAALVESVATKMSAQLETVVTNLLDRRDEARAQDTAAAAAVAGTAADNAGATPPGIRTLLHAAKELDGQQSTEGDLGAKITALTVLIERLLVHLMPAPIVFPWHYL